MHTAFQFDQYLLKRQVLALTGKFRLYGPGGELVLYSQQKMFRLKEDIRAYSDESCSQELLYIQARQVIDFSACYDVHDSLTGEKVGALRRRGWRSLTRDVWDVLGASDQVIGVLQEDDLILALFRRVFLGSLLPQNYDLLIGDRRVADLRQRFNLFRYELEMDFREDRDGLLNRRLGVAAALLLGTIEGKQQS
jgi:uncharacterized protein YxjI